MVVTCGTGFKEIRSGLSNNWPAPIVALFWGLLAVLEVHALNLGKQLVSSSHARQGWWCSTPPTSRPETTTKERKLGAETENRDRPKYCPDAAFRDLVARALQSWDRPGRLGARWMDVLSKFFQYWPLTLFNHPGYPVYFSSCTPCQWTASAGALQSRPVRRTWDRDMASQLRFLFPELGYFCRHSCGSTRMTKHWAWILVKMGCQLGG